MTYDLQLSNVGKVYDDGTAAVIDFNLDVQKGEFIAFLGPSGCGKTTTLRMVAGFESITSGDILIRGRRINDLLPEQRPTAMIFQNYALFPHMTVRQNVAFGLEVKGMERRQRDDKVARMLNKLELDDIADMRTDRLSGGQRQRIALARSLVIEPDILLLDEPLGALDANLRKSIQNELKLLQRELGITFVFVTHAQSEALALSDRIVVMSNGRVEQISPPLELYTRPKTLFVAQFIGNNTIIPGTVREIKDGAAVLDTGFGPLAALVEGPAPQSGTNASIVLPAEALRLHTSREAAEAGPADQLTNAIDGKITRLEQIGHIMEFQVELPNGTPITIEGHSDIYGGQFAPGDAIHVSWQPGGASVITQ
ncbi:MAG: ABC transporter ATP-binding protein [Pararhodobacter sp.]|nr:ABC transporter ATP-binding protein [Pararhodobacter sp.]